MGLQFYKPGFLPPAPYQKTIIISSIIILFFLCFKAKNGFIFFSILENQIENVYLIVFIVIVLASFEITVNDKPIYSKLSNGSFPDSEQVSASKFFQLAWTSLCTMLWLLCFCCLLFIYLYSYLLQQFLHLIEGVCFYLSTRVILKVLCIT